MNSTKNNDYCIDITKEWIKNSTPNSHKIKEQKFFDYHGIRYRVDNKKVVLDYSSKELNIAIWLKETFGGEIYLLPRINEPPGIKTADYIFNREKWDLKTIVGKSKQTIYHAVYKKEKQSQNFILDITNSQLSLSEAKKQVEYLFLREDTKYLSKVIIKKNYNFKIIEKRKKECNRAGNSARPHSL